MAQNVLEVKNRREFRQWLQVHSTKEKECWVVLKRGKPVDDQSFWYLDAVEEALCFGWIDSTLGLVDGVRMQRFAPRSPRSSWTELNKERVRRLERLGLMTEEGRRVLPDMSFTLDKELKEAIKKENLWEMFSSFPPLYQRVRAGNLLAAKKRSTVEYEKAWTHFVKAAKEGKLYGEWNDYGRLAEE